MRTSPISSSLSISIAAIAAVACTIESAEPIDDPDPDSDPDRMIHVTTRAHGADGGACTSASPCRTLPYALQQVAPGRDVIRVGGDQLLTTGTITIDRPVAIDARDITIVKPLDGPIFRIEQGAGLVTIEGLTLLGSPHPDDPTVIVGAGSTLRISGSTVDTAVIDVRGGTLDLLRSRVATYLPKVVAVRCWDGAVRAREVSFEHAMIAAMGCGLDVRRSRFLEDDHGSISANGGVALIENNLIIQQREHADAMYLTNVAPGSALRFNTFVNASGAPSDGAALDCDGAIWVTSNIFAYGSLYPIRRSPGRCPVTYSLFDTAAAEGPAAGEGNVIADPAAIFADRAAGDLHLAAGSPAKGAAEPGLGVREDLDGFRRPVPSGSRPDIGALEAW